jgi:hypothetical protein
MKPKITEIRSIEFAAELLANLFLEHAKAKKRRPNEATNKEDRKKIESSSAKQR